MESMHFINHQKPLNGTELLPKPPHYDIQNGAKIKKKKKVYRISVKAHVCARACVLIESSRSPRSTKAGYCTGAEQEREQGVLGNVIAQGSQSTFTQPQQFVSLT